MSWQQTACSREGPVNAFTPLLILAALHSLEAENSLLFNESVCRVPVTVLGPCRHPEEASAPMSRAKFWPPAMKTGLPPGHSWTMGSGAPQGSQSPLSQRQPPPPKFPRLSGYRFSQSHLGTSTWIPKASKSKMELPFSSERVRERHHYLSSSKSQTLGAILDSSISLISFHWQVLSSPPPNITHLQPCPSSCVS